jgi:hypothetical protein
MTSHHSTHGVRLDKSWDYVFRDIWNIPGNELWLEIWSMIQYAKCSFIHTGNVVLVFDPKELILELIF